MKKKRIGLALGGGGAKGIAHIAFLKVLDELEIKPAAIAGTSIGAIIGTLYASGLSGEEIEDLFCNITVKGMSRIFGLSFGKGRGLLKIDKASAILQKLLKYKNIEDLPIPMKIVATDFWNRKEIVLEKGRIVKALQGSSAIPGILRPLAHEGKVLIDGGIVNPLPYDLLRKDCDIIIAIDVCREGRVKDEKRAPRFIESIYSSFLIMQKHLLESKIERDAPEIYIHPCLSNIGLLEFYKARKILAEAEKDAEEFRKELKELL